MCDAGFWEAAGLVFAAFIIGGFLGMTVMALLVWGEE